MEGTGPMSGLFDVEDSELSDLISDAVDDGYIEEKTAAHGIALQVINQGFSSLTDAQKRVYNAYISPALKRLQERRDATHRRELMERDD